MPKLDYVAFCSMPIYKQLCSFHFRNLAARVKTAVCLHRNTANGHPLHDTQAYWKGCRKACGKLAQKYDAAVAWGQGTPTHFVAEKVKAEKKFAWVNADYEAVGHNKKFDEDIYEIYDNIICVSDGLKTIMRQVFPNQAEKMRVVYDIQNAALIQKMAEEIVVFRSLMGKRLL